MIQKLGGRNETVYTTTYALITLSVSAFARTSLDTATRLGRYLFAEFFLEGSETYESVKGVKKFLTNPWTGTIITVVIGVYLASGGYLRVWPLFGAANQLLAGLALLAVAAWLGNVGKSNKMFIFPMVFMLVATITSLCITFYQRLIAVMGGASDSGNILQLLFAAILVILAVFLVIEGCQTFAKQAKRKAKA
jgi:carbon starvation protein